MTAPVGGLVPSAVSGGGGVSLFWLPRTRIAGAGANRCASACRGCRVELAQRRHVVEHPDRAALRRGDEVVAVDEQVAHPARRQVALQRLPMRRRRRTRRRRRRRCRRRASPCLHGIGAHDVDEMAVRQAVGDLRPGLAVVVRADGDAGGNRPGGGCRRRRRRCRVERARRRAWRSCAQAGMPCGVTSLQVLPPSRVSWIRPSSVPTQISSLSRGEGAIVKITP